MKTKSFPLRVVLTALTGRLLTKQKSPSDNGIGDLYAILNHMTKDNLFTHQLPRAGEQCATWLRRWFPELSQAEQAVEEAEINTEGDVERLLEEVKTKFGLKDEYAVPTTPSGEYVECDPLEELQKMSGGKSAIVIVAD